MASLKDEYSAWRKGGGGREGGVSGWKWVSSEGGKGVLLSHPRSIVPCCWRRGRRPRRIVPWLLLLLLVVSWFLLFLGGDEQEERGRRPPGEKSRRRTRTKGKGEGVGRDAEQLAKVEVRCKTRYWWVVVVCETAAAAAAAVVPPPRWFELGACEVMQ